MHHQLSWLLGWQKSFPLRRRADERPHRSFRPLVLPLEPCDLDPLTCRPPTTPRCDADGAGVCIGEGARRKVLGKVAYANVLDQVKRKDVWYLFWWWSCIIFCPFIHWATHTGRQSNAFRKLEFVKELDKGSKGVTGEMSLLFLYIYFTGDLALFLSFYSAEFILVYKGIG